MIFEKQVVGAYKGMIHTRCDDTESVFYFSEENFAGLKAQSYIFNSSLGHSLQGYIYSYDGANESKLVIFDHGFGGGHRAYMREIEKLCSRGYVVFAYDHTGCMQSGGENPGGLSQSLRDLNDCILALKQDQRFIGKELCVMGHSWGAFSTLNICAFHKEITKIVAISGFVSVEQMINTFFSGIMKGYRKPVMQLERDVNPDFVNYNAVESLANSNVKALLIYSENDKMCKKVHYDILKEGLKGKDNVSFMLVKNKGHNPNYTEDAVKYLAEFSKKRAKLLKNKNITAEQKSAFVASFDWIKMTEQDEIVWDKIFNHLES